MGDEGHDAQRLTARRHMVEHQLRRRGLTDQRVLEAMLTLPRERFLTSESLDAAYNDQALPIGHGQTISQPYIVAYMTEQLSLTPDCTVLEIGTGTGYQTAVLALLAKHVYTVERLAILQEQAAKNLAALKITNVSMTVADGSVGLPEHAPYHRIMATAAAPRVSDPLVDQLAEGGVLVIPIGGAAEQTIVRVTRQRGQTVHTPMLACRFVKLIGKEAWPGHE